MSHLAFLESTQSGDHASLLHPPFAREVAVSDASALSILPTVEEGDALISGVTLGKLEHEDAEDFASDFAQTLLRAHYPDTVPPPGASATITSRVAEGEPFRAELVLPGAGAPEPTPYDQSGFQVADNSPAAVLGVTVVDATPGTTAQLEASNLFDGISYPYTDSTPYLIGS